MLAAGREATVHPEPFEALDLPVSTLFGGEPE